MPHAGVSAPPAPPEDRPDRYRGARPADGAPFAGKTADRRTVTIRGYGADRQRTTAVPRTRRSPSRRRYERVTLKPDRAAMWAVMLGVLLIAVAALSAHP